MSLVKVLLSLFTDLEDQVRRELIQNVGLVA